MPTPRETILHALLAVLNTVPGATVLRGATLPERIPPAGLLILRDGDPGTPEVTLEYSAGLQAQAAEEVQELPKGSALVEMLSDYAVMREQAKRCSI